jgi:predicted dehydrogenase
MRSGDGAVGVGIIGTGFGRLVHLPSFRLVEEAAVVGVASRTPERARQAAEAFGLRAFGSWRELVECPEVHAVSVATPPATHEEIVATACAAGKSVLCEKPLATDAAQAARMLRAARAAGITHVMGFEFREMPAWRFARRLLRRGRVGRLRHVSVSWLVPSWADPGRGWSWRSDLAQGGGTLEALGVHALDYLEWMLGPVGAVAAQLTTRVPERPDGTGAWRRVSSEDCCHVLLALRDGTPGTLVVSSVAPVGSGHWFRCDGDEGVLVVGSENASDYGKGFGVWLGRRGSDRLRKLRIPAALQFAREFEDGRIAPFHRLARRFVAGVAGKATGVRPSFAEGARAQLVLELIRRADRERRWVEVPPPDVAKELEA